MNTNIELKDEISVDEYKAWLTGLLRGKGTQLPDLKDWKAIKKMTDKIVPEVIETTPWVPQPLQIPPYVPPAIVDTPAPLWWENQPTCGGTGATDGDNITITNGSSTIAFNDTGSFSIGSISSIELMGNITPDGTSIGSTVAADYGSCYSGYSASHASSYTPPVSIIDDDNEAVEAVGRSIIEDIRRRSENAKAADLQDYKFDPSNYLAVSAVGEHLDNIAKITGFKK